MSKEALVETVSPEELRRSAWAITMHIAKQQESLRAFQARQEVLIGACQSALESIEILEGILPEGSLARGSFDGAFLGVKAKLRAAIERESA